jgi:hypothetical protein
MFSDLTYIAHATTFDALKNSISIPNIDIEYIQDKVETVMKVKEEVDKLDLDFDFKHKVYDQYNIDIDKFTHKVHLDEIKDKVDIEKLKTYGK